MKLAVLISGSLRTFNECWPANHKVLSNLGIHYEIFLHSWDENYSTNKSVQKGSYPRRLFWSLSPYRYSESSPFNFQDFVLNDINLTYKKESVTSAIYEIETHGIVDFLNLEKTKQNTLLMYFGMQRVYELFLNSQHEFTHFLRIRPDFKLSNRVKLTNSNKLLFLGPGVQIDGKVYSDQAFFGPLDFLPVAMCAYDNLVRNVLNLSWSVESKKIQRIGEYPLYENLKFWKLENHCATISTIRRGKIIREALVKDTTKSWVTFQKELLIHNRLVLSRFILKIAAKMYHLLRNVISRKL
jgi:hypothetical protein